MNGFDSRQSQIQSFISMIEFLIYGSVDTDEDHCMFCTQHNSSVARIDVDHYQKQGCFEHHVGSNALVDGEDYYCYD